MNLLAVYIVALTVVCIYYLWRAYCFTQRQRERILRERIAYLLWTMADRAP